MKNITVTLPDEVARRTRIEAAHAEKSVSRFIADLLIENVAKTPRRRRVQLDAIEGFLSGPDIDAFEKPGRSLREQIYEDFRGLERDRVQSRSRQSRKKG